jgi:RNA polymerase sigma factor (sigma-70 family)
VSVQRHDQVFDPALGDLYHELAPLLLRYAEGILGSRADAEEAVQDAFLAAASAQPLQDPRPWLFRVTRNAAIDQLRRRRHLTVLDPDADPFESSDPSPHDHAELSEELGVLRAGVDRLPEQQRSALMLRELAGLHYREISGIVDVSEANVKVLIFRARRSLQEFAEAHRLPCDSAQVSLSAYADGEAGKAEYARARLHTATCSGCRTFNAAIQSQRAGLAMLVPLAPIAGVGAGAVLSAAAGAGAKAGGGIGGFFGMKAAATAAAVVVVGTGAVVADHQGLGIPRLGHHTPQPVRVNHAIIPSDPQPKLERTGGGGSAGGGSTSGTTGGTSGSDESAASDREHHQKDDGGVSGSGSGSESDSGSGSGGERDTSGRGSGGERDSGAVPGDSSGTSGSGHTPEPAEEPSSGKRDSSGSGSGTPAAESTSGDGEHRRPHSGSD